MAAPMRLYIGGLPGDITNEDLEGRFRPFGQVDIRRQKEPTSLPVPCRGFAFMEIAFQDEKSLAKCLSSYNNARWRGNALRVARAKQSPLVKLLEEIESERQQQTCAGPLSQGQPTSAQKRRFLGYSRISALIRSRGVPVEPYMDTRLNRDEKSDQGSRREAESEDEEGEVDEATFIRNYRRTLAESGLPRKAVRSAVRALEEADAIEVVKPGAGGRGAQEQHQDSPTTSTGDVDESSETELASDDHEAWLRHLGVADVFSDGSGGESEGDRSHGRPSTGSDGGDSQGGSDSGSEGALEARRKKGVKRRVHSAAVPEEHAWRIAEEKRQSRGEHGGGRERREGREARAKPALPNRGTWAGIGGTREGEGERSGGRGATGPGERAGVPTGASRGMGADGGDTRAPGMAKGGEQGEKGGPSRAGPSKPASAGGVSGAKRAAGPEGRALGGAQRKKGKKGGRGVSGGAGELGAALASFLTSDAPNIGMTFTREEIRKSKPWLWDKGPKGPKRKPLSLDE